MLYYVEMGVAFTNEYGDIHEAFYSSMEGMYEKALKAITKQQLQKVFQGRCGRIVRETSDIGWGFHDTLGHIYYQHYDEAP